MMRFWVAALTLACLAVLTSADVTPAPNDSLCQRYSDGTYLNIGQVFNMLMTEYKGKIENMGTEKLKDFMNYADADRDNRLNLAECEKLLAYVEKPPAPQRRRR